MNKKVLIWSLIIIFSIAFTGFVYATDIVMDLNSSVSNTNDSRIPSNNVDSTNSDIIDATNNNTDNTIYSTGNPSEDSGTPDADEQLAPEISTTTTYEESGDLSVTNMINIILIVVGVVLILLGIAIIIRMKS